MGTATSAVRTLFEVPPAATTGQASAFNFINIGPMLQNMKRVWMQEVTRLGAEAPMTPHPSPRKRGERAASDGEGLEWASKESHRDDAVHHVINRSPP